MTSNMALISQNLITSPISSRLTFLSTNSSSNTPPKIPNFPISNSLQLKSIPARFPNPVYFEPLRARPSRLRVFESEGTVQSGEIRVGDRNLEALLSIAELLCLALSAILAIGLVVNWVLSRWRRVFLGVLVDGVLAWQAAMVVSAVALGAWIRRRQWRRLSSSSLKTGSSEVNVVERIEKLEEDIRSSTTIVRVLSRQLEKLGIRFRVTRKALKGPITETAALAQKNSEATRALAAQEDILEKELGEIQQVLMAMQEQQQKQLELILAICKSKKLLDSRLGPNQEQGTAVDGVKQGMEPLPTQPLG